MKIDIQYLPTNEMKVIDVSSYYIELLDKYLCCRLECYTQQNNPDFGMLEDDYTDQYEVINKLYIVSVFLFYEKNNDQYKVVVSTTDGQQLPLRFSKRSEAQNLVNKILKWLYE